MLHAPSPILPSLLHSPRESQPSESQESHEESDVEPFADGEDSLKCRESESETLTPSPRSTAVHTSTKVKKRKLCDIILHDCENSACDDAGNKDDLDYGLSQGSACTLVTPRPVKRVLYTPSPTDNDIAKVPDVGSQDGEDDQGSAFAEMIDFPCSQESEVYIATDGDCAAPNARQRVRKKLLRQQRIRYLMSDPDCKGRPFLSVPILSQSDMSPGASSTPKCDSSRTNCKHSRLTNNISAVSTAFDQPDPEEQVLFGSVQNGKSRLSVSVT